MKSPIKVIIFSAVFSLLAVITVHAQKVARPSHGTRGTWRILGTTQAKHSADHDAIIIAGPFDYFRKLKFKVTDAPLNMIRMVVTYDDGGLP